jgi:hypothetical protein
VREWLETFERYSRAVGLDANQTDIFVLALNDRSRRLVNASLDKLTASKEFLKAAFSKPVKKSSEFQAEF